jgi:hypothetical protein
MVRKYAVYTYSDNNFFDVYMLQKMYRLTEWINDTYNVFSLHPSIINGCVDKILASLIVTRKL